MSSSLTRSSRVCKTGFVAVLAVVLLGVLPAVAFAEFPEAPATEAVGSVTGTTATLTGELNPGVGTERVSYHFNYSPGGECNGFLSAPAGGPFPEAEGNHQKVSEPVTGLEASTTYWVCLVAANPLEEGEATQGSTVEFTTTVSKPVIVTQTAANVTPFAASLQAEVNPENQATTSCVFEYGKVLAEHKLPCEQLEFSGPSPETATRALAGLSPGTKYHFRVIVKNATGETKGAEQTFETLPIEAPAIVGESVSAITPVQARLEGVLNPEFQPTKCSFSYGVSVGEHKVPCEPELFEGSGEQGFGATITGLTPATTYHYLVQARNTTGETEGSEQEFTTLSLEAPIFASENAVNITNVDAQLEARINPDAQETTSWSFEYATTSEAIEKHEGIVVTGEPQLPAVYEEVTAGPVDLGGKLTPSTKYFYRVTAANATGTLETAPIQEFETLPAEPPIVTSETASSVGESTATFEGQINPNNHEATYLFEYSTEKSVVEEGNGVKVEGAAALPAVNETLPTEPLAVTGLEPSTEYFYRVVASNPTMGTTNGPIQSFHTLGKPAIVVEETEETTRTTAVLFGTVNPRGASTTYKVIYTPAAEYNPGATECPAEIACAYTNGQSTITYTLFATGYTPEQVGPIFLEGLTPGTVYHYTIIATNSTGTTVGPDETLITSAATPPTAAIGAASGITATAATITATVNTQGLSTSTSFQIGTEPGNTTQIPASISSQAGNTLHITATVEGLQANTVYTYQATATNADGTSHSGQATLKTLENPAVVTLPTTFPNLTFTPISTITAKEETENKANIKKELLNRALKACKHKKNKHKRVKCERSAHHKYGR